MKGKNCNAKLGGRMGGGKGRKTTIGVGSTTGGKTPKMQPFGKKWRGRVEHLGGTK